MVSAKGSDCGASTTDHPCLWFFSEMCGSITHETVIHCKCIMVGLLLPCLLYVVSIQEQGLTISAGNANGSGEWNLSMILEMKTADHSALGSFLERQAKNKTTAVMACCSWALS